MKLLYCHYVSNKILLVLFSSGRRFIILGTKNSVPSQYLLSRFYLKLPLEVLTKENNNEKFHGLSLILSRVLRSKSISHLTSINPRKKKRVVVGLDLFEILILTLILIWF